VLLVIPLVWSIRALQGKLKSIASPVLLLILPFLVPGPAMLHQLVLWNHLPESFKDNWWWHSVIMPHQVWVLALLSVCLVYALTQTRTKRG
jgi:hypothetical protein